MDVCNGQKWTRKGLWPKIVQKSTESRILIAIFAAIKKSGRFLTSAAQTFQV
jgi:hypothetical protein